MEKKIWSNKETKMFIALFKENQILWNKNLPDFRNLPKKRKIQYNLAVEFNTSVAEIGRKVTILRTQWLKERKKMKNLAKHYESRWKWFKPLKPIFDLDPRIKAEDDDDDSDSYGDLTEDTEPISTYLYIGEDADCKELSFMQDEDCKLTIKSNNDEYQIFGNYVATKLRCMHNEKNLWKLKKLIQQHIDHWTEEDDKEYFSTKIK